MKEAIKILYNGKDFKNVEKAVMPDVEKLVTLGMEQNIREAISPLLPAIEKEGGQVMVNIKGPMMFEVEAKNISEELKKKVMAALTPSG